MRSAPYALLLAFAVPLAPAGATGDGEAWAGTFEDPAGVHDATLLWDGSCLGFGTLTLIVHRVGGDDVRAVDAYSYSQPPVCVLGCSPCDFPYYRIFEDEPGTVLLAGAAPLGPPETLALAGPFQDGALAVGQAVWPQ